MCNKYFTIYVVRSYLTWEPCCNDLEKSILTNTALKSVGWKTHPIKKISNETSLSDFTSYWWHQSTAIHKLYGVEKRYNLLKHFI